MAIEKYPEIIVQLTGQDGNGFMIVGKVRQALERAGIAETEIEEFTDEATSGDYDHLLSTCMEWVTVQ